MSFSRPTDTATKTGASREPKEYVLRVLTSWSANEKRKHGSGRLPSPLPIDFDLAADAWMTEYQKPRQYDEAPVKTTDGLIDPYISRLVSTLALFLMLPTDTDRRFVRACIEDGIDYRGEPPALLRTIYEETMKMRSVGFEAYRAAAIEAAFTKLGVVIPNQEAAR